MNKDLGTFVTIAAIVGNARVLSAASRMIQAQLIASNAQRRIAN